MNGKSRKLLLAGLLGLVILYLVGDSLYQRFCARPLQAEKDRQQNLESELHKVKLAMLRTKNKLQYVSTFQDRSLPSKPEFAVSEYHDWLLHLVEASGLKRLNLNSSASSSKSLLRRITFTVRGVGTLKQVTQFLHTFYQTGHLHKIRSLSLNPSASGKVNMACSIEAVSLANATSKDTLTNTPASRLAGDSLEFYNLIAQRDLFQGTGNDWAKNTKLAGITKDRDGNVAAWFQSGDQKAQTIAKLNEAVRLGNHEVTVLERSEQGLKILIDGEIYLISLGQTFAECFETAKT